MHWTNQMLVFQIQSLQLKTIIMAYHMPYSTHAIPYAISYGIYHYGIYATWPICIFIGGVYFYAKMAAAEGLVERK